MEPFYSSQYQPIIVQVSAVAALVRDLNLEIYALRGAEASLEQLLGELAQQATKHPAGDTTRQCLLAIQHCTTAAPDAVQASLLICSLHQMGESQSWRSRRVSTPRETTHCNACWPSSIARQPPLTQCR